MFIILINGIGGIYTFDVITEMTEKYAPFYASQAPRYTILGRIQRGIQRDTWRWKRNVHPSRLVSGNFLSYFKCSLHCSDSNRPYIVNCLGCMQAFTFLSGKMKSPRRHALELFSRCNQLTLAWSSRPAGWVHVPRACDPVIITS